MKHKVLVTGGAGFIGSHLVDKLIGEGHDVRVLDNFEKQVHGDKRPEYLNPGAKYIEGDVRSEDDLKKALEDIETVFHFAAMVGVGQSMYQIKKYTDVNTTGTANLLDVIVNGKFDIRKIVVASSMSIYGEGIYKCENCGEVYPKLRTNEDMKKGSWELRCQHCNKELTPVPTHEEKPLQPTSVYAVTKKDQEELVLNVGRSYGIPSVALRFFNVYGPRQSLNNPYTGVAAIFSSRIKNNNPPLIFEDGKQSRDFTSVHDIVQANMLVMKNSNANYDYFNVGTGRSLNLLDISEVLTKLYGKNLKPEVVGKFREGDIRHCYADISKLKKLGYSPKVTFEDGMKELVKWGEGVNAKDTVEKAFQELEKRGLSH